MVNMEWDGSTPASVSKTDRSSRILVGAIVLLADCGSSAQTLGAGTSTPPSETIVRAMAVADGRGDAAELCMRAAGFDDASVRLPDAPIDGPAQPVAGYGIGDLGDLGVADGSRSSSQTQAENRLRYGKLDAAQQAVWDRCVSDWLGQDRESKDISAAGQLGSFISKQGAVATAQSADAFKAWSACVASSTGVTVDYPWTLRKQLVDEWTRILEQNGAEADRAVRASREAGFKDRARTIAEADAACCKATAQSTFDTKLRSLIDQAPPDELTLAEQLLATRPSYSGWMDRENAYVKRQLP